MRCVLCWLVGSIFSILHYLEHPPTVREIDARDASAANAISTWEARRLPAQRVRA
ncbi:hypothetical protein BDP81DRAFT_426415 [Colletotrichum phormii]|uniref:Uncharacterized protein n=1 Tax=Colletotrichum phormii TaxID=359342 RepID=A0AAI9ZRS9_9PEZI|nr:uncharacterized protein BDP81DRAFT_426415 [Colletotrichum phormii]KAK1636991.1 hypothetical protein BDP81DRAFT_426415 [Colletotrichum phormii]